MSHLNFAKNKDYDEFFLNLQSICWKSIFYIFYIDLLGFGGESVDSEKIH